MTEQERYRFVKVMGEHCSVVADDLLNDIREGKIPTNWTGPELRQLFMDRLEQATILSDLKGGQRKQAYQNAVLVNNL